MHLKVSAESITKNKGLEESEGCGYIMLNLGGTEKFDIAFRFIELLSETTPKTLNPIPSKNGCHQSKLDTMKSVLSGNYVVYINATNSRKETISVVVMDLEIGTHYL
ncbi:hypothetical protein TNIN_26231 [Trichonephila inaurata madagascariensis]|uniref:Uncharacterized protein n=1 Tax=Trichonephila inaurata madagascariensis TaxID=2747483 RepID=A0A8X6XKW7_9ARAC|nr:hypothetical protein TNIN_26231 [Trichonephila inaurata madagascariensis]